MLLNNNTNGNYTMRQLKLPLEIEKLIGYIWKFFGETHIHDIEFSSIN